MRYRLLAGVHITDGGVDSNGNKLDVWHRPQDGPFEDKAPDLHVRWPEKFARADEPAEGQGFQEGFNAGFAAALAKLEKEANMPPAQDQDTPVARAARQGFETAYTDATKDLPRVTQPPTAHSHSLSALPTPHKRGLPEGIDQMTHAQLRKLAEAEEIEVPSSVKTRDDLLKLMKGAF